jgi:hypothetical protein
VPTAAVRAVVVSWNGEDLLPSCLDSLLAQTVAANLEVVVVDYASEDGMAATLAKRYRAVTSLPAGPHLRFAGGADLGVAGVAGEFVALPSNDTTFAVDAIERMISVVQGRDVCVIQPARHRHAVFDPPRFVHQKVRRPPPHPRGPTTTKGCPLRRLGQGVKQRVESLARLCGPEREQLAPTDKSDAALAPIIGNSEIAGEPGMHRDHLSPAGRCRAREQCPIAAQRAKPGSAATRNSSSERIRQTASSEKTGKCCASD